MKKIGIALLLFMMTLSIASCSPTVTEPDIADESHDATMILKAKIMDINGALILLANMVEDAGPADIYHINADKTDVIAADGSNLDINALEKGMLVEVIFDGTIMESYPMGLGGIKGIYIKSQGDDMAGFYKTVVDDLYAVDPGLNGGISMLAFDFTKTANLTEAEKAALIYRIGNIYKMEAIAGTYEELCEQGYIDKDKMYFEKGLLFTIEDTAMSGDSFTFNAKKWRSGKANKYTYAIIEVLILAVVALLAFTVLNTEYLFGWATHNWEFYLTLGGIALLLLFLNKRFVSTFMTAGIAAGIFIGNFLGGWIKRFNEMKKLMLFFIGFIPLPVGYIMNYLMMSFYYDKVLPYGAIGIIFLTAWFGLGLATYHFTDSDKEAVVIVHLLAFIDLLLVLFQEVIIKHYWFNKIGIIAQLFYLPLVNIAGKLVFFSNRVYWIYVAAFAFMCIAFYLGRLVRKKRITSV